MKVYDMCLAFVVVCFGILLLAVAFKVAVS
jgi:hypothetical protein